MSRTPDNPLLKITLNLYKDDVDYLRDAYGYGWSERVRQIVHDFCRAHFTNKSELDSIFEVPHGK